MDRALVLAGVSLSLAVIYLTSKIGGEVCTRINLPPVLGELVGGVGSHASIWSSLKQIKPVTEVSTLPVPTETNKSQQD